jgi:hypothetical protein
MAGRSKVMRLKQSLINNIDAHTFSGPMKSGTAPSIGVTHNYWYNYATQCNTNPNQVKKSYDNMVFLNINPAQTPVSAGFRPTTNYNYSYNSTRGVGFYDSNVKYDNHYYRPRYPIQQPYINSKTPIYNQPSRHMTGFVSKPSY